MGNNKTRYRSEGKRPEMRGGGDYTRYQIGTKTNLHVCLANVSTLYNFSPSQRHVVYSYYPVH